MSVDVESTYPWNHKVTQLSQWSNSDEDIWSTFQSSSLQSRTDNNIHKTGEFQKKKKILNHFCPILNANEFIFKLLNTFLCPSRSSSQARSTAQLFSFLFKTKKKLCRAWDCLRELSINKCRFSAVLVTTVEGCNMYREKLFLATVLPSPCTGCAATTDEVSFHTFN